MKRLDQLTFIRFGMVLFIVLYHGYGGVYEAFLQNIPFFDALIKSATTAVGYMYVLSGFIMSLVYYRPSEKFEIITYWKSRFVRIYPLYLIAFLLTCVYYLDTILRVKPQKILVNLLALQAWYPPYAQSFNYPAWSITVEIFFYFIFPFFTIWAYRQSLKKLIWGGLAFWAASQVVYQVLWIGYFETQRHFVLYFPLFHLNSFILGAVGGIWYVREGKHQQATAGLKWALLAGSAFLSLGYLIVSMNFFPSMPRELQPMAGLLAPVMVIFIIALALDESKLSKALQHPWLVNLGEASYAIYILHIPVIWFFEKKLFNSTVSNPEWIFSVAVVPMVTVIGLVMYLYVDTPIRNGLKKILPKINAQLFFIDLIIFGSSIFISFYLRFGDGRDYLSYRTLVRLLLWAALFLRIAVAIVFRIYDESVLRQSSIFQSIRPVFISALLESLILTVIGYLGFHAGFSENFPRSIFLVDFLIVITGSVAVRLLFRFRTSILPGVSPKP
ncbi:MAG: acyltransferase family protein [Anaerolineales bacterium]|uniref:acyltransferase family protein n=1 Tax=Candidatus Villigracilis vicinus TaxID=3140679 RepID=UPI00313471F5|nr:acyltransferase family protein [Anaerolineales bacterium]